MNEYGEYFIYGSEKYDKTHPNDAKNIVGCIHNGIPEHTAKAIWDKMVKFASYAFNKSHATCYAALSARTAWLACHFPVEHMTGILNSYLSDNKKLARYVRTCYSKKIALLPPDINLSDVGFKTVPYCDKSSPYNKAIVFGLSGISGVGSVMANSILHERSENGPFSSVGNFLERMAPNKLTKTALEALILTGAFDSFPGTRAAKMAAFDDMLAIIAAVRKSSKNQVSFFDVLKMEKYEVEVKDIPEYSLSKIAKDEYDLLGYYIHHPVYEYSEKLSRWREKGMLTDIKSVQRKLDQVLSTSVRLAGVVTNHEVRKTKAGKEMVSFDLDDGTGSIKCLAFKGAVERARVSKDCSVVYLLGDAKSDDFGVSCIINEICILDDSYKNKQPV